LNLVEKRSNNIHKLRELSTDLLFSLDDLEGFFIDAAKD